jgi:hypothetical protein
MELHLFNDRMCRGCLYHVCRRCDFDLDDLKRASSRGRSEKQLVYLRRGRQYHRHQAPASGQQCGFQPAQGVGVWLGIAHLGAENDIRLGHAMTMTRNLGNQRAGRWQSSAGPAASESHAFRLRHAQDVEAAVDANNFARCAGARVRGQVNRCAANRLERRV